MNGSVQIFQMEDRRRCQTKTNLFRHEPGEQLERVIIPILGEPEVIITAFLPLLSSVRALELSIFYSRSPWLRLYAQDTV